MKSGHQDHKRNRLALCELALAALGALGVVSTAAPAAAQTAFDSEPTTPLVLHLSMPSIQGAGELSTAPTLRQAYRTEDEDGAVNAALRRVIDDAPAPASWDNPRMIVFAGGGDEALVWSPANNGERAQFNYRDDRVEMGSVHAGFGWEAGGATLTLGYIENDYQTPFGSQSQSSAGVGLAWRR